MQSRLKLQIVLTTHAQAPEAKRPHRFVRCIGQFNPGHETFDHTSKTQHEKTENITEEFILYGFLGVFVIYVCDSFTRSGKYIR